MIKRIDNRTLFLGCILFLYGLLARVVFLSIDFSAPTPLSGLASSCCTSISEIILRTIIVSSSILTMLFLWKICEKLRFTKIQIGGTLALFWLSGAHIFWSRGGNGDIATDKIAALFLAALMITVVLHQWLVTRKNTNPQNLILLLLFIIMAGFCRLEILLLLLLWVQVAFNYTPVKKFLKKSGADKTVLSLISKEDEKKVGWIAFLVVAGICFLLSNIYSDMIGGDMILWILIALLSIDVVTGRIKSVKTEILVAVSFLTILQAMYFLLYANFPGYFVILLPLLVLIGGMSLGITAKDISTQLKKPKIRKTWRYNAIRAILMITAAILTLVQLATPFLK